MPVFTNTYTQNVRLKLPAANRAKVSCAVAAKYKARPAGRPSADDADQLFAYSHVTEVDGYSLSRCGLIYPGTPGVTPTAPSKLIRERDGSMDLLLASVRFPASGDARNRGAWNAYLGDAAQDVATILAAA